MRKKKRWLESTRIDRFQVTRTRVTYISESLKTANSLLALAAHRTLKLPRSQLLLILSVLLATMNWTSMPSKVAMVISISQIRKQTEWMTYRAESWLKPKLPSPKSVLSLFVTGTYVSGNILRNSQWQAPFFHWLEKKTANPHWFIIQIRSYDMYVGRWAQKEKKFLYK